MPKPRPITFKLNVTKIAKEHMFKGQTGTYLDCVVWPNKNGPDDKGFTHYIVQEVSKTAREQGVKGAIIGNLKLPQGDTEQPPAQRSTPSTTAKPPSDPDLASEDIPF